MILRCGTNHRRTADVDILDRIVDRRVIARDRLLKGIEIHGKQVDRLNAVFIHHRLVGPAPAQQPAVNHRVQRLDAAVHDLRETGFLADFDDVDTGLAQCSTGSPGGENLDSKFGQSGRERNKAMLVRNAEQRPSHLEHAKSPIESESKYAVFSAMCRG